MNNKIISFRFSTVGYLKNFSDFIITKYDETSAKCIIDSSSSSVKLIEKDVPIEVLDKLDTIVKKYNLFKWNGFDKHAKNVLDGHSFTLQVQYSNNDRIYATGYMKYPKHYKEAEKEILELFKSLCS